MIGEFSVTWLITELLSVVLFVLCMLHALTSDKPKQKLFELICFILAAAIFEHFGVLTGNYWYSQKRLMMFGLIPLSILMIEAVTMYAAMVLFESMNMPKWTIIWFVGLLSTVQDMTIGPVYVHDTYVYDGVAQGQWNWKIYYDTTFFGIPFFNFSSWFYMTGLYAGLLYLGRHFSEKGNRAKLAVAYPFLSAVLLLLPLIPTALILIKPIYSSNSTFLFWYELIALILNCAFGAALIAKYWNGIKPVSIKKDGFVVFCVPLILHLYDVITGFALGIKESYVPVILFTVLHMAFLLVIYQKSKKHA